MGTALRIQIGATDPDLARRASEVAVRSIEACEKRWSTWLPDSELSRLNRTPVDKPCPLSATTLAVLTRADRWVEATSGGFDPGAGAIFQLWGLRQNGRVPTAVERQRARAASGFAKLRRDAASATRAHADFRLEAGAFGKGLALDLAISAVRELKGITHVELDFGGQLAWWRESGEFTVGIRHPRHTGRILAKLTLPHQGSVATSGNGEQRFKVESRRFGHLIDPRTAMPAPDFGSVTVFARTGFDADCLSTGLYILGADKALVFAERHPDIEVVVCTTQADDNVAMQTSAGLRAALTHIKIPREKKRKQP